MQLLTRNVISEFMATFILVLLGVGAVALDKTGTPLGDFGIALSFGLAVYFCIQLFSATSGAQMNPVVTWGFYLLKQCSLRTAFAYLLAQCAGATVACLCLKLIFGDAVLAGVTRVQPDLTLYHAFFIEVVLTFLLMFSVLATKNAAVISLAVFLDAFLGGPLTGASMNPARSFGPALVMHDWTNQWLYWIAPLCGGLLAMVCCGLLLPTESAQDKSAVLTDS